jgi:hypothetical protein
METSEPVQDFIKHLKESIDKTFSAINEFVFSHENLKPAICINKNNTIGFNGHGLPFNFTNEFIFPHLINENNYGVVLSVGVQDTSFIYGDTDKQHGKVYLSYDITTGDGKFLAPMANQVIIDIRNLSAEKKLRIEQANNFFRENIDNIKIWLEAYLQK